MKFIKSLSLLGLFIAGSLSAQKVKSQSEHINSLQPGTYYAANLLEDKKKGYNYDLYIDKPILLKEVSQDPNFIEHKYFVIEEDGSEYNYVVDNYAFPVTYGREHFEGNKRLQEKVGYVPREFSQGRTVHVAIIDGLIYDFNWKFKEGDASTYVPYRVLMHESFLKEDNSKDGKKKKKKKLSLKERMMRKLATSPEMKAALRVNGKLREMDAAQIAVDYVTQALTKQKNVESKWMTDSYNSQRIQLLDDRRKIMFKAMKKYNDDLMDTPEWRRIVENNRRAEAAGKANNVTIENNTGKDVWLYAERSMNGTVIRANSSGIFDCKINYYYAFSGNAGTRGGNAGPQAYSAGSGCGSTMSVN